MMNRQMMDRLKYRNIIKGQMMDRLEYRNIINGQMMDIDNLINE